MADHDVIVVGAGNNGLATAGYLAKAGLNVCVVDRMGVIGGASCTEELTVPGFKHDPGGTMHILIIANPLWQKDELGLRSKYGLKYIFYDTLFSFLFDDESSIVFYPSVEKTVQSIATVSKRDAEVYPEFIDYLRSLQGGRMAGLTFFSPTSSYGRLASFADSSEQGREYLRVLFSSSAALAKEWFESEKMQVVLSRWATDQMIGPTQEGTGFFLLGFDLWHRWGYAFPEGGSGKLAEALAAGIRDNGGIVRLSSPVKSFKVEGGEAKGVVLESGEEITAKKAIVSSLNIKQLFLDMIKQEEVPQDFARKVRNVRVSPFSALHQSLALNEPVKYKGAGEALNQVAMVNVVPSSLEEYLRSVDSYYYGIPVTRTPCLITQTLADPTRAPEGKHTLYCYHTEPYHLKDGGATRWDDIRQEVADAILDGLRDVSTNMGPENILGRHIMSPLDIERWNPAMVEGDVVHLAGYISQYLGNRPIPGWHQYRTPVKRLYMTGAGCHPGGGISCASGRAAAQVVMEDLGIDFKKIAEK